MPLFFPPITFDRQFSINTAIQMLNESKLNATDFDKRMQGLVRQSNNPISTVLLLMTMDTYNLINNDNLKHIEVNLEYVKDLSDLMRIVEKTNLMTDESKQHIFLKLVNCGDKKSLRRVLETMIEFTNRASTSSNLIDTQAVFAVLLNPQHENKLVNLADQVQHPWFHELFFDYLLPYYFQLIMVNDLPEEMAKGLGALKSAGLLDCKDTAAFLHDLQNHESPLELCKAYAALKWHHLLFNPIGNQLRGLVFRSTSPRAFVNAICSLQQAGILASQAYYDCLLSLQALDETDIQDKLDKIMTLHASCSFLFKTVQSHLLEKILNHPKFESVLMALPFLNGPGLMTGPFGKYNLDLTLSCPEPFLMAELIVGFYQHGLLSGFSAQKHRQLLSNHPQLTQLHTLCKRFIFNLNYQGSNREIVAQKIQTFKLFARHSDLNSVSEFLTAFHDGTEQALLIFMKSPGAASLIPELISDSRIFWSRLRSIPLNADCLNQMTRISQANANDIEAAKIALVSYIRTAIRIAKPSIYRRYIADLSSINEERYEAILNEAGSYTIPEPQAYWICPITLHLITEAVSSGSAYFGCYEKSALFQWLIDNNSDPITREPVSLTTIVDRPDVSQAIEHYLREQENVVALLEEDDVMNNMPSLTRV